jgi:hypothetical protein
LSVVPVCVGGIIYIIFRPESLLMFRWFNFLGISSLIYNLRSSLYIKQITIPFYYQPLIYSLPNALWLFSFVFSILYVWKDSKSKIKYFWILLICFIGIGGEIGQALKFIPGVFDITDSGLSIIAIMSANFIFRRLKNVYEE